MARPSEGYFFFSEDVYFFFLFMFVCFFYFFIFIFSVLLVTYDGYSYMKIGNVNGSGVKKMIIHIDLPVKMAGGKMYSAMLTGSHTINVCGES